MSVELRVVAAETVGVSWYSSHWSGAQHLRLLMAHLGKFRRVT